MKKLWFRDIESFGLLVVVVGLEVYISILWYIRLLVILVFFLRENGLILIKLKGVLKVKLIRKE